MDPVTLIIVCPLVFLAGLVDSIAGGGGLISLTSYLIAGLPAHAALGTNKLSSAIGAPSSPRRAWRREATSSYAWLCLRRSGP
ncbi:MAG: TSUP family transporter [Slackia sp.]